VLPRTLGPLSSILQRNLKEANPSHNIRPSPHRSLWEHQWRSTSSRMNISIPLSFSPLLFLTWLYVLLIIVHLLSTAVHVVSPWHVKTVEASFSFHSTDCSTLSHIPDLTRVSGSFHHGRDPCPLLLEYQHPESPLGHFQSATLTMALTFVLGVRRVL
jgi:hypothetical protein